MRPRIKNSAVLVARSDESRDVLAAKRRAYNDVDDRPFVQIFDKRLYISRGEIEFYTNNGFAVQNI